MNQNSLIGHILCGIDALVSSAATPTAVVQKSKVVESKALEPTVKQQLEIEVKENQKRDVGKLVQKEGHTVGSVKAAVYQGYFNAIGRITFWSMIFTCIVSVALSLASATWLGIWSEGGAGKNRDVFFYISIYVALSLATVFFIYASNALGFAGAVTASATMHADFVHGLMRAPISFFDSTPLGRITNRLAKDMGQVDTVIMFNFQLFLRSVVGLLGTVVVSYFYFFFKFMH